MIINMQDILSELQAVTAIGDTPSTNSFDTGPQGVGGGKSVGKGVPVFVKTGAAVTSGGAATVQIVLQDSADNASFADVQTLTPALAPAALGGNKVLVRAHPGVPLRRYVRIVYRVGTAVLTGGSFTAMMIPNQDNQQYQPSGWDLATGA